MAKFDATTKHLVEVAPLDWVTLIGFPDVKSARVVDADLSTITAQADKVILVEESAPWMIHIKFQAAYDPNIGLRQCRYNVLIEYHHKIPVLSVLVLLSPDADGPAINGALRRCLPNETCYDEFRYQVIRVWELSPERLLAGGLGTLPLAPLTGVPESQLPVIIDRIKMRVDHEILSVAEREEFWVTTSVLLGMRISSSVLRELIQGVINMKESSFVQGFLEEGELNCARRLLLRLGERHLGKADPVVLAQVNSLVDLLLMEDLMDRIRDVRSWEELLSEGQRLQSSD